MSAVLAGSIGWVLIAERFELGSARPISVDAHDHPGPRSGTWVGLQRPHYCDRTEGAAGHAIAHGEGQSVPEPALERWVAAAQYEELRAAALGQERRNGGPEPQFRGDIDVRGHRTGSAHRRPQHVLGGHPVGPEVRHRNESRGVDRQPEALRVDDMQPAPSGGRLGRGPVLRLAGGVVADRHDDGPWPGQHTLLVIAEHDPPPEGGVPALPRAVER